MPGHPAVAPSGRPAGRRKASSTLVSDNNTISRCLAKRSLTTPNGKGALVARRRGRLRMTGPATAAGQQEKAPPKRGQGQGNGKTRGRDPLKFAPFRYAASCFGGV